MRKFLIFIILLTFCLSLFANETNIKKVPFKAAVLSFCIPGAGQFYNEHFIKSGFVIALEGGLIGLAIYHHIESENYYDKYTISQNVQEYDKYIDYYYKRQNDLWWLGTTIFLSTIDAFVDAHLYDFDSKKQKIHLKFENNILSLSYNF